MLDAHPNIWGMGEDSVFNVRLPQFRDDIIEAIQQPQPLLGMKEVISKHGGNIFK
jgi:hypothetical protein